MSRSKEEDGSAGYQEVAEEFMKLRSASRIGAGGPGGELPGRQAPPGRMKSPRPGRVPRYRLSHSGARSPYGVVSGFGVASLGSPTWPA